MNTIWVVKGSKFCNMRCAYCYEWDELDSKDRISLDLWRKIFVAMRDQYAAHRELHPSSKVYLALHGGEPLVLPREYREAVMAIRADVLGADDGFQNAIQTNLLNLTDENLDWLERHAFDVGVSFDVVPGVRVSLGGRETERTVMRNMDRLRERGIAFGAIAVMAKHTIPRITQVYDFFAARGIEFRVLPLRDLGVDDASSRPVALYTTTLDEIERAFDTLFRHWLESGMKVPVRPLGTYLQTTLRKMAGLSVTRVDPRLHGEPTFVVNTNGGLYLHDTDYSPARCLGDLQTQTFRDIMLSNAYQVSLEMRNRQLHAQCSGCEFASSCEGWPVLSNTSPPEPSGRCAVAYRAHRSIERYLSEEGFGPAELREMLHEHFGVEPPRVGGGGGGAPAIALL